MIVGNFHGFRSLSDSGYTLRLRSVDLIAGKCPPSFLVPKVLSKVIKIYCTTQEDFHHFCIRYAKGQAINH
jgi:hypothetical protein